MTAITNTDVTQALAALRSAIQALTDAISAQSKQVNELAEENARLHDTVKNRDETIAYMRDRNEQLKQGTVERDLRITELITVNDTFATKITRLERDLDEMLKSNIESSDEIKALRQIILDVSVTTARADNLGSPKNPPSGLVQPSTPVQAIAHDPASTYGG